MKQFMVYERSLMTSYLYSVKAGPCFHFDRLEDAIEDVLTSLEEWDLQSFIVVDGMVLDPIQETACLLYGFRFLPAAQC